MDQPEAVDNVLEFKDHRSPSPPEDDELTPQIQEMQEQDKSPESPGEVPRNPDGFPPGLLEAVSGPQNLGDRERALLKYIRSQGAANDAAHWNRGAAVHLLHTDGFSGQPKKDTDKYLKEKLGPEGYRDRGAGS